MIIPGAKREFVKEGEEKIKAIQKRHWNGFLTEKERYEQTIRVWADVKKEIESQMKKNFDFKNPIYKMIDSGARGNWGNITQLCGMKGLVASPTGKIIELPIKSNLKEGFSTLEYFIATHGGRKGKADTALKTAQSGYLTRRLVDAAQNIMVREHDCGTHQFEEVIREKDKSKFRESFEDRIFGKTLTDDLVVDGEVILPRETLLTRAHIETINQHSIDSVKIRSILSCQTEGGVCQKCYGLDLGYNKLVALGTPVGIIAAQSIGEPGTQLTMRTFHSGGVAKEGGDITQGLTRVEELFESRTPKYQAVIAEFEGDIVSIAFEGKDATVIVKASDISSRDYYLPDDTYDILVKRGEKVEEKKVLARSKTNKNRVLAERAGVVDRITDSVIIIRDEAPITVSYSVDASRNILVKANDHIRTGDKLVDGHVNLQHLMSLTDSVRTAGYIVNEIKGIYSSQGQTVHSKHIELIVRQMFSKIKILSAGDSTFFPGDIVDIITFSKENLRISRTDGKEAIGTRLLLGVTKISLFTDSWLSSASFQETVRILVDASTTRKIDSLEGLKENVIIGRLIPTLRYFENNRNVGEYFDTEEDFIKSVHDQSEMSMFF